MSSPHPLRQDQRSGSGNRNRTGNKERAGYNIGSGHHHDRAGVRHQRCAIYTRVSTEHGLDMEFNSLDAQREACEAYITSQKHEGWACLPGQYNDGGFSGGSLERPDLKRLMADIRGGRLDIIVVYKVDRLTRSLANFAKLVELFDAHNVSFVSVTQSFNTTSSMGRLTLNVLHSFAQFEREVTSERIRDKIAASKKKGIRMGGTVPLGYGLRDKKLIIDESEAATVRAIFEGYFQLGSLSVLMRHLDAKGIVTKRTLMRDGSIRGGVRFGKGALFYLLRNRVYVGEITHAGQSYPAEHLPIVERALFDAVQEALKRPGEEIARRRFRAKEIFPLAGLLLDDRGNRMTPTVAKKNGAHYRYYISSALLQGRHAEAGSITRVNAQEIEEVIAATLREEPAIAPSSRKPNGTSIGGVGIRRGVLQIDSGQDADPGWGNRPVGGGPDDSGDQSATAESHPSGDDPASLFHAIDRVIIGKSALQLALKPSTTPAGAANPRQITIPWSPTKIRRYRATRSPDGAKPAPQISADARSRLQLGIARARSWLDDLFAGRAASTDEIARREGCSERHIRVNLNLAFLPPAVVKAAIDGTLPEGCGVTRLIRLPVSWQTPADERLD